MELWDTRTVQRVEQSQVVGKSVMTFGNATVLRWICQCWSRDWRGRQASETKARIGVADTQDCQGNVLCMRSAGSLGPDNQQRVGRRMGRKLVVGRGLG